MRLEHGLAGRPEPACCVAERDYLTYLRHTSLLAVRRPVTVRIDRRLRCGPMPPYASELAQAVVGRTIYTLDRRLPNVVRSIEGADVIVGDE